MFTARALTTSLSAATSEGTWLHARCGELHRSGQATICRAELLAARPLGAIVLHNETLMDASDVLYVYQFGGFVVRPDPGAQARAGCSLPRDVMRIEYVSKATGTRSSECAAQHPMSSLSQLVEAADTTAKEPSGGALAFRDCLAGLHAEVEQVGPGQPSAQRCLKLSIAAIAVMRSALAAARSRSERNALLRRVVTEWGSPAVLGGLLLLHGAVCDAEDSYDEFTTCRVQGLDKPLPSGAAGLELEVNVWQRNIVHHANHNWTCSTCGFHNHPFWFASRVVAGSVTHSMAHPTCRTVANEDEPPRTFAELDADLPAAGPEGTQVDRVGAQYTLRDAKQPHDMIWRTCEVVRLLAGETLLFPPSWFHRVVPPAEGASHAAVTLVAKYSGDIRYSDTGSARGKQSGHFVLRPSEFHTPNTRMRICWSVRTLVLALRDPHLDVRLGSHLLRCENEQRARGRTKFNR
jgi:hypothetical protein